VLPECAHTYPDGRRCRRIPKSGETLCPGHHPRRRRRDAHAPDFVREMHAWVDRLQATPLEPLLVLLQESLAAIQSLIERKTSRAHRAAYTRAYIAVTHSIDRLEEEMAAYRAQARRPPGGAPSTPALCSPEELNALCEKLLRALPSDAEPQLP
jgi:hypothetical protein